MDILKRYEKWKDIAMISGPQGLRAIKGFRDEALSGDWKGFQVLSAERAGESDLPGGSRSHDCSGCPRYTSRLSEALI